MGGASASEVILVEVIWTTGAMELGAPTFILFELLPGAFPFLFGLEALGEHLYSFSIDLYNKEKVTISKNASMTS